MVHLYKIEDNINKAKRILSMLDEQEQKNLSNNVGLHSDYKSWADFLDVHVKEGGKKEDHNGWFHYTSANQHYIVDPDGNVYNFVGYRGSNAWRDIKENPEKWLRKYSGDLKSMADITKSLER